MEKKCSISEKSLSPKRKKNLELNGRIHQEKKTESPKKLSFWLCDLEKSADTAVFVKQ